MRLSRRLLLAFATLAPGGARAATASGDAPARIAALIADYAAQGDHRTGSQVDRESARWLASRLNEHGVNASLRAFAFQRVAVSRAAVILHDKKIPGLPLFDGGVTGAEGVSGTVVDIGEPNGIGVVTASAFPGDAGLERLRRARLANTHAAIIVVTHPTLPPDGIAAINADEYTKPFGPPVLQVPHQAWPALKDAMGTVASVAIDMKRAPAEAFNVEARIAGREPDLAPLVVMTPRSGWGPCAAERGGGIAAFVEIARAMAADRPRRPVIFTANSGHELGHLGLDHFLAANPGLIARAALWLHLGANFVSAEDRQVWLQYSSPAWQQEFGQSLAVASLVADKEVLSDRPLGEARSIAEGRGAYVSILGTNGLFHHPADRWPAAVDLDAATAWIGALTAFSHAVANRA